MVQRIPQPDLVPQYRLNSNTDPQIHIQKLPRDSKTSPHLYMATSSFRNAIENHAKRSRKFCQDLRISLDA